MIPRYPDVRVQLTGRDGNAFAVIGAVRRALVDAGESDAAEAFVVAATDCDSYGELLRLALATVDVA